MKTGSTWLRGVRVAAAALLVLSVATTGCGRPDDEAWLRCLGFRESGGTSPLSVLNGDLGDGTDLKDLTVDVDFQNSSLFIGGKVGTGILVNHARIDYRMSGFSPPSAEYPANLYLPPPAESTPSTGTLTLFPLASVSLQQWLIDAGVSDPVIELTARVTFYSSTDEGNPLETEASIRIALTNTGGTGAKPTVTITKKADASIDGVDGGFTVIRTGSTTASLTVDFTTAGDAFEGIDYFPIGTSMRFSPGIASTTLPVTALSSGTVGRKLIINLSPGTSYDRGTPSTATLKIIP